MLPDHGDRTFGAVVAGLRCKQCGGKPAPVYLVAGLTRQACMAPRRAAVELVHWDGVTRRALLIHSHRSAIATCYGDESQKESFTDL